MTREREWIAACLGSLGGAAPPPPADLNWELLLKIAETEAVAAALGFVGKAATPLAIPMTIRQRLERHLIDATVRQLILSRELSALIDAFDRHGIPVIPLKGPALAEMLYPRPGLRPSSDLDVLIDRHALVEVDGLLQGLGYRRVADEHSWAFDVAYDRATLYEGADGVRVDLHWSLVSDPRFSWNEAAARSLWQRATKIPVGTSEVLSLCPEDLLVYLAVHLAVHHGLAGLLWYWDLARLLEGWSAKLDWDAIAARATGWRVKRAVYFALRGCDTLFGVSAPRRVMSRLRPRGPRAAALRWLVRRCDAARLKRLEHVIALLLVDRARDVIASIARVVFPSYAWLRARYETAGPSLAACYLTHWRRMATIGGATVVAAVRHGTAAPRDR